MMEAAKEVGVVNTNPLAPAVDGKPAKTNEERWREEAAFFDAEARRNQGRLELDPLVLRRYGSSKLKPRFNKEFRFMLMGSLEGKRILDVGCGEGGNVSLLAALGAQVTGIDISPGAIELAKRRAEKNGVADRVELICSPIETANLPAQHFDIIWGEGVLHHLLHDLDGVMKALLHSLKPDGLFVFGEPISLSPSLRALRKKLPITMHGTPDERPLEPHELRLVGSRARDYRIRHYGMLGRLDRFILTKWSYEHSAWWRRLIVNSFYGLDTVLLALPGFRRFSSSCVLYGRPA